MALSLLELALLSRERRRRDRIGLRIATCSAYNWYTKGKEKRATVLLRTFVNDTRLEIERGDIVDLLFNSQQLILAYLMRERCLGDGKPIPLVR